MTVGRAVRGARHDPASGGEAPCDSAGGEPVESLKFDFLGLYRPAVILGNSNTPDVLGYVMPLLHCRLMPCPSTTRSTRTTSHLRWWRSRSRRCSGDRAGRRSQGGDRDDPGVQGDGALLRQGRARRVLSRATPCRSPRPPAPTPSRAILETAIAHSHPRFRTDRA